MNKTKNLRANSWTSNEDMILAEAILISVRNGRTTGDACRTVAGQLGRTPGACKFRWNTALRMRFEPQLEAARRERLSNGRPVTPVNTNLDRSQLMKSVNGYLNTFDHEYHRLINRIQTLVAKRDRLRTLVNDRNQPVTSGEPDVTVSLEQLRQEAQLIVQTLARANKVLEQK